MCVPLTPVRERSLEDESNQSKDLNVTLFDISTTALSTIYFATSAKLGEGGFGTVYREKLEGGQTVAVKRLSKYLMQALDEFKNEVVLIAKLQHTWKLWRESNAVSLLDEAVAGAGTFQGSEVLRCVQVGLLCVQERPEDRPHMAAVFLALGNPGAVLPQPRHPGYCTDRGSASTDGGWSSTCTTNDLTVTVVEGR
ncbi:hypothetical protein EJB05_11865, partial [Eragrostis curvula]